MKAYKVVKKRDEGWVSFGAKDVQGREHLCLEYGIDMETIPSIGRILAFDSYGHALSFMMHYGWRENTYAIMEGKARDPIRMHRVSDGYSLAAIRFFWRDFMFSTRRSGSWAPAGTIAVSSFTPERFVLTEYHKEAL